MKTILRFLAKVPKPLRFLTLAALAFLSGGFGLQGLVDGSIAVGIILTLVFLGICYLFVYQMQNKTQL